METFRFVLGITETQRGCGVVGPHEEVCLAGSVAGRDLKFTPACIRADIQRLREGRG